jgi:hypothetical protein
MALLTSRKYQSNDGNGNPAPVPRQPMFVDDRPTTCQSLDVAVSGDGLLVGGLALRHSPVYARFRPGTSGPGPVSEPCR